MKVILTHIHGAPGKRLTLIVLLDVGRGTTSPEITQDGLKTNDELWQMENALKRQRVLWVCSLVEAE